MFILRFGVSLGIATLLYPVMVYAGMQYFEPAYVALIMLIIVTAKLFSQKALLKKLPWLKFTSIVGIVCLVFSGTCRRNFCFARKIGTAPMKESFFILQPQKLPFKVLLEFIYDMPK